MPVQGLWNIGGLNLPDYGISEWLGIGPKNTAVTSQGALIAPPPPTTIQQAQQLVQLKKKSSGASGSWAPTVSSGGGGQLSTPSYSAPSYEDIMRGQIESGYNEYFNTLNRLLESELPAQRTAQEDIVKSQLAQGQTTLTGQKTEGMAELGTQKRKTQEAQVKSLKDISENIRNQMMAGNVYLGSLGVGDSSAANMYTYALEKVGTKARGDVMTQTSGIMNDIADREFKLNNLFNTEMNNLTNVYNQKISEIANWYAGARSQVQQLVGQGQLNKGRDLANVTSQMLNYANQQLMMAQQDFYNTKNALRQWAVNHSQNIQQIKDTLAQQASYAFPGITAPSSQANVNFMGSPSYGYYPGTSATEKRRNPYTGIYE